MTAGSNDTTSRTDFHRVLTTIRRRRRGRQVLEAVALVCVVTLVGVAGLVYLMDQSLFDPTIVDTARNVFYLLLGGTVLLLVVPPLLWPISDVRLAHYTESAAPELDALVLSAVEAHAAANTGSSNEPSPALTDQLVHRAAEACRVLPAVAGMEQKRTRRSSVAIAGIFAATTILLTFGPEGWRHGAWLLLDATQNPTTTANPYSIRLTPGDITILAGEDVYVAATPEGFSPEGLVLQSRRAGTDAWARTSLSPSSKPGVFETHLFDVDTTTEYRIEHPVLKSPRYRIEVVPRPVAERIDLRYEFPEYTAREPEVVSGGGDIIAVLGTRVEVIVTPSQPTEAGRLMLDGERVIPLRAGKDGMLRGHIELTGDGRYRVELRAGDYGMAPASPEHAIITHTDDPPIVELRQPAGDVQVTSIEEVVVEAEARDDVAVRNLELIVSVNGGPDEVVDLSGGSEPQPTIDGRHEFFLEDRNLAPGDLIAYYVRARDAVGEETRQVSSDIYFMDVRPFDMSYRRSRGGAGGGGGGQQDEQALAAQQRTLVVALFKVLRDHVVMDNEEFAEQVETLNTAQARIRERVDAIVRRLKSRRVVQQSTAYRRMAEELPQASKSMVEVEALLAVQDIRDALPSARNALLHLQRADSAFREAQVAQAQQSGGGGNSAENDLANLFRLELDRFRSPYEDIQRGAWTPPEQQIDDLMRKLRELAERQRREIERTGVRGQGSDSESRRALAEELDELARELQRLTRQQPSDALRASLEQIQQAARAMRRSADKDSKAGAEALDRLRDARRLLDAGQSARLAREAREALNRAETMAESQTGIEHDVGEGASIGASRKLDLVERKQELAGDVEDMESRLKELAGRAGRGRRPDVAAALERAAGKLRGDELAERIRRTAEQLVSDEVGESPESEAAITQELESLRDSISAAADRIDASNTRLSDIHEELREAMRSIERNHQRLTDRVRRGPALSGTPESGAGRQLRNSHGVPDIEGISGLAGVLAGELGPDGSLDALEEAIEDVRADPNTDAETLTRHQAALLAALQELERRVRARIDTEAPTAWGWTRFDPPLAQREDVETYYRNLSER